MVEPRDGGRALSLAAMLALAGCPGSAANGASPPVVDSGACPSGTKLCAGECVDALDPLYGCLPQTCAPCNVDHVNLVSCRLGVGCLIERCNPDFDDCDHAASNGCEADLRESSHCGNCKDICSGAEACRTGSPTTCAPCTGRFIICDGGRCVDPTTDPLNCGGCDDACPGDASCIGRQCAP